MWRPQEDLEMSSAFLPCRVMGLVSRLSFTVKSVIPWPEEGRVCLSVSLRFGFIPGWIQWGRQRYWDKPAPRREDSICQHSCDVEGLLWEMHTPPEPGELWAAAGPVPGLCLDESLNTVHWKAPGFYKWVTSWDTGVLAACYPHS